jgi:hypothetical protein
MKGPLERRLISCTESDELPPALALDEHGEVERRDALAHEPDRGGLAEEPLEPGPRDVRSCRCVGAVRTFGRGLRLRAVRPARAAPADDPERGLELCDVDGFLHEVQLLHRERREGLAHGVVAAHQHDVRPALLRDLEQEIDPRAAGQHDVEQHDVVRLAQELGSRLAPRSRHHRGEAEILHERGECVQSSLVILDEQCGGHRGESPCGASHCRTTPGFRTLGRSSIRENPSRDRSDDREHEARDRGTRGDVEHRLFREVRCGA